MAENGHSPGRPSPSAVIHFDVDEPPKYLTAAGEASNMDSIKSVQQRLARETQMKEQALAELQVR